MMILNFKREKILYVNFEEIKTYTKNKVAYEKAKFDF